MKKWCRQCEKDVLLDDFYRHPKSADGVMAICKTCHRSNVKSNRDAKADHYRAFERARANLPHRVEARRAYAKTPEGRAASKRANRSYIERNPLKRSAHIATGNAIRDGRLIRQPCEVCGKDEAQAHHEDYSKPLDVRWLCTTHHAEWHQHNTAKCPNMETAA